MRLAAKSDVEISTFGVGIRLSHSTQPVFENVKAGKEELKDPRTGRTNSTDDREHRMTKSDTRHLEWMGMLSVVMVRDSELRRSDRNLERSTDDHLKQEEESNNETTE